MTEFRYTVTAADAGLPVKKLLRSKFSFSSRLLTKIKYQHLVTLNGAPVDGWIVPACGDVLCVRMPEEASHFLPEPIPIQVVYEDEDLLLLNKQSGITVHPTKGRPCHTIANGLMQYQLDTGQSFKIRFVNRLDMDTTGLLIVAKHPHAQADLIRQMQQKQTRKQYLAIVNGIIPEDRFTVDLPIGRTDPDVIPRSVVTEGGYPSVTHVQVLERFAAGFTLVSLRLETGRTHQIRVHLSHLGYPLVGDHLYGGVNPTLIPRQALHACLLSFRHPATGAPLTVTAPLPEDMRHVLRVLRGKTR